MVASSPTVLKRYVAFELLRLREATGMERKDVAARLHSVTSHVSHLETARNLPRPSDLEVLLGFYGAADRLPAFLELVDAAKKGRDWWEPFKGAAPKWFDLFLGLESCAERIERYDAMIVPGLFQIPEYAEAVIRAGNPMLTDAEVARRVKLRMVRQDVLARQPNPPTVWCVLDESVLHRPTGNPLVLANQVEHLSTVAELPNVTIQVLPLDVGVHAGVGDGTFIVLDFPPELAGDPGVVYTESSIKGSYHENPADIGRYRDIMRRVQVAALNPDDSIAFLTRRFKELP
ncbi:MAG: helix-turn-helix domain-containing protein [Sciscionella sp.]